VRQVVQRLRDGRISVEDVPPPSLAAEGVLVEIRASLVSAGTERRKVETGRQSLIGKARARPDDVRAVIQKAKRDGVGETIQAVRARLDQPGALGYSAAGVVLAVGARVSDVVPGDRVACAGAGYAVHAEIDHVPGNLVVALPDDVGFVEGAFATVGSVALHAVRQADVRLGERVAVIGLGLVGQLAGQILRAAGCRVVGIDLSAELVARALADGAADAAYERKVLDGPELPREAVSCDAVVVTAATASSDPVRLAARLCRDRGHVVIVGDVGMEIPREAYYEKELELRVSRSYGPGRYDRAYEERGLDYPIGYVRWTERRNMAAFLDLISAGKVKVQGLITERVPVERAPEAYDRLVAGNRSPLGIVLEYEPTSDTSSFAGASAPRGVRPLASATAVGVIGAGSFATRILIPGLKRAGFELVSVASASGVSAKAAADRFGFRRAASVEEIMADEGTGLVAIAARHASHATLAARALRAGKGVYVEKPPCLTGAELDDLRAARAESGGLLAVGFNRRHAPLAVEFRELVHEPSAPIELLYRVNAGLLPADHWVNDLDEGGGRLLGEGCHFVDFACWVVGRSAERVACTLVADPGQPLAAAQSFSVTLGFPGGSLATILYGAHGAIGLRKEYVEAHSGGRSAVLDDFRSLTLYGLGRRRRRNARSQDKGHGRQFANLHRWAETGEDPVEPDPLESMAVSLAALASAETGAAVSPREIGRLHA
jgi:predicted dehydrogenase